MEYDNKTFAKKLREGTVTNDSGIVLVSPEMWEHILSRIEQSVLIKDDGSDTNER